MNQDRPRPRRVARPSTRRWGLSEPAADRRLAPAEAAYLGLQGHKRNLHSTLPDRSPLRAACRPARRLALQEVAHGLCDCIMDLACRGTILPGVAPRRQKHPIDTGNHRARQQRPGHRRGCKPSRHGHRQQHRQPRPVLARGICQWGLPLRSHGSTEVSARCPTRASPFQNQSCTSLPLRTLTNPSQSLPSVYCGPASSPSPISTPPRRARCSLGPLQEATEPAA